MGCFRIQAHVFPHLLWLEVQNNYCNYYYYYCYLQGISTVDLVFVQFHITNLLWASSHEKMFSHGTKWRRDQVMWPTSASAAYSSATSRKESAALALLARVLAGTEYCIIILSLILLLLLFQPGKLRCIGCIVLFFCSLHFFLLHQVLCFNLWSFAFLTSWSCQSILLFVNVCMGICIHIACYQCMAVCIEKGANETFFFFLPE